MRVPQLFAGTVIHLDDLLRYAVRAHRSENGDRLTAVVEEQTKPGFARASPGRAFLQSRGHEVHGRRGHQEYNGDIEKAEQIRIGAVGCDDCFPDFQYSDKRRNQDDQDRNHDIDPAAKRQRRQHQYAGECQQRRVVRPIGRKHQIQRDPRNCADQKGAGELFMPLVIYPDRQK